MVEEVWVSWLGPQLSTSVPSAIPASFEVCNFCERERERDEAEEDTSASMEEAYWETTTVLLTDFPDH